MGQEVVRRRVTTGRPLLPGGGLRQIRRMLGPGRGIYTLRDLAERTGVTISTLSMVERGGSASIRLLAKIAEAYGVSYELVLDEHERAGAHLRALRKGGTK